MTNVTNEIDISKLKRVDELKGKIKDFFTNEEIIELAKNYQCPHYVLNHPITKERIYLFIHTEVNEWLIDNYLNQNNCLVPQTINVINYDYEECQIPDTEKVPIELIALKGLCKLPDIAMLTPPGIYFLCRNNKIVYVGQSSNVVIRIHRHILHKEKDFDKVFFIPCHVNNLMRFEAAFIRLFKPQYNATFTGQVNAEDMTIIDSYLQENE